MALRRRALELIVLVVGAASLGTEIAAARLLAPYFGASTIVWANTIATVLVALSVGYWLGGRLADRRPFGAGLCRLVLAAAFALAVVPFVARPFLDRAVSAFDSLSVGAAVGSLIAVLVIVAGPVLLLGAVAPYAIRLSLERVDEAGTVAGRLYAISTAGSLAGTFLAALVLVPFAGTHRTFLAMALALALAGAIGLPRAGLAMSLGIVVLLALPPGAIKAKVEGGRVLEEAETPYQYARVVEASNGTRRLELNEGHAVHSLYRPGRWLTDDYWDDFLALPLMSLGRAPRRIVMLGGAAGTVARAYGHFFPRTWVDDVEIDARLTELGRRWFDLRGPRLRTVAADARPFLRATQSRYDGIFLDAYRQPYIPFYLTTREFFELCRARLEAGGVVVINVGHPEGSVRLERVLTRTLRAVFPSVWRDPAMPTNTLLVAAERPPTSRNALRAPHELAQLLADVRKRSGPGLSGGEVFTDDRAPVEWLIDGSIIRYASGR